MGGFLLVRVVLFEFCRLCVLAMLPDPFRIFNPLLHRFW